MRKKLSTLIPSDLYEKKDGYNGKVKFTEKGKNHIIKELKINKKHPLEIAKSIGLNSSKTIIKFLKSENIDIMKEYLDRKGVVKLCECGNKYKVKPSRSNKSNYCSGKCAGKYKVPSEKIICVECNKDFYVNKFRKDSVSFCSIKCKSNSKIWKDKISIGNTGKHRSEEFKKNVSILFKIGFLEAVLHFLKRVNYYM